MEVDVATLPFEFLPAVFVIDEEAFEAPQVSAAAVDTRPLRVRAPW